MRGARRGEKGNGLISNVSGDDRRISDAGARIPTLVAWIFVSFGHDALYAAVPSLESTGHNVTFSWQAGLRAMRVRRLLGLLSFSFLLRRIFRVVDLFFFLSARPK